MRYTKTIDRELFKEVI